MRRLEISYRDRLEGARERRDGLEGARVSALTSEITSLQGQSASASKTRQELHIPRKNSNGNKAAGRDFENTPKTPLQEMR